MLCLLIYFIYLEQAPDTQWVLSKYWLNDQISNVLLLLRASLSVLWGQWCITHHTSDIIKFTLEISIQFYQMFLGPIVQKDFIFISLHKFYISHYFHGNYVLSSCFPHWKNKCPMVVEQSLPFSVFPKCPLLILPLFSISKSM